MNGIVISIDPIIFNFGAFQFRWYSLAIILAIVAALFITTSLGKKKGIADGEIYTLAMWAIAGGIVGARLFHVVDQFAYYSANPLQILQFQQGGLAIWGALVGGGVATFLYARVRHIPLGRLADALAPALLVAHIIGRVGCIINGDAYGGVTDLPWGFIYTHPDALIPSSLMGQPTHPYPVYEMIWNGLALFIVVKLAHSFKKDGLIFLSYLSLYSLGRFILTFVRQETTLVGGLQQAQIMALIVMIISASTVVYYSIMAKYSKSTENAA